MKTRYAVALALLGGVAVGATAIQGLHAQTKPPVYIVNEIDVTDPAAFQTYADRQSQAIQKHGGRYIIRGGKVTPMEGAPPKRFTIYVFDNMDKMQAWEGDQADIKPLRAKAGTFRTFAVEGLTN